MTIEAQNRSLKDWMTRIGTRQVSLPRFQRFEAWEHQRVTQLFNTILQDLPVGALLVLNIGEDEPFVSRPMEGAPKTGERVVEHLLDGQQRLTALWRGLTNNYPDRTFHICLSDDPDSELPFWVDSIARSRRAKDTESRPFWANSPRETWERKFIPLDLFAPGDEARKRYTAWAKQAMKTADERELIAETVDRIREKFLTCNIPFLALPIGTPKGIALDVFIKMNTSAAPLTTYDIVVAQVEAGLGQSLHDMMSDVRQDVPAFASYGDSEGYLLSAGALLQGATPTNANFLSKEFAPRLLEAWDQIVEGAKRTVSFLEEERIFDAARLPTDPAVQVLIALWAGAPQGGDAEGRARTLLRRYFWRACFSNRYERTTSSRALEDFTALKRRLAGADDVAVPIFDETQHSLPTAEELLSAGWPKKRDRVGRAILAVALRHSGIDLADGAQATRDNLLKREYHHLFPNAMLAKQGQTQYQIFRSLNCALVSWKTNRQISDKDPERYLAERRDGTDLGEAEVRARLSSHLIPYDEMVAGDYDAFLIARAQLIHAAMVKLCNGEAQV